jgi:large subunit ribosomal protein L18
MVKTAQKVLARQRRKKRVRKRIFGTPERPRLSVFKSAKHIYAQIIDDVHSQTLVSASTLDPEIRESIKYGGNIEAAKRVGALVGKRALEKGIKTVVFDRNGFLYHGRVKALADSAREVGLKF